MEHDSVQNIKIEHSKRKGVSSFVLSNDTPLKSPLNLLFKKRKYIKSDIFLSDYEFCMVKTEQTVTAKTAMLLQF